MAAKKLLTTRLMSSLVSINRSVHKTTCALVLASCKRHICAQSTITCLRPSIIPKMELSALQRQRFYATDATSVFETRVLQCVKEYCKTHEGLADPTMESRFKEDMNMDSLDQIELMMLVEDEFGIEIPEMVSDRLATPAQVVEYLKETDVKLEDD